jgi:dipeptidyl aminopeptidase/acylaminoacyl peptidase
MRSALFLLIIMGFMTHGHATPKQYTIEQFLDTKNYLGGSFTHDEKEILVGSNESGVYNIYALSLLNGKQTQLTYSDQQAISLVSALPHDDRFLFSKDEGGNERHHLYLGERNGAYRDLTPFPGAKVSFHSWSHDRKSFFFTANARDPRFMDLYEMDIETFTATLRYQNESGFADLGPISPDKSYIALQKVHTSNNSDLYLFHFATSKLELISQHQGDSHFHPATFSPDSKSLYFLTDEASDFTYLKRYQIDSKEVEKVEAHDWDIWYFSFSRHGRYRITILDQDSSNRVRLFDRKIGKEVPLPHLPEGEIVGATVSPSEEALLLSVEGDRSPTNIYLFYPANGSYRKITDSLSPEINPEDLVEAEIIRYPSYDGMKIPALFYKPLGLKEGEKVPALIWVHGGPGGQSRKGYHHLMQYLANHGYAVLAVNNRGSSGYGKRFYQAADLKHGEADLDDCIWAKKFLASTGFIDEKKIGISGGSYGGFMTLAALAFRPDEMAVGVDIFGVANWVRTLKSIPAWWESEREALYKKIGDPDTQAAYLESISPLFHVQNIVKPLLVIQGANDPRVLQVESDEMVAALQKNGVPIEYILFPDEGHGFANKKNSITAGKAILDFLDKHLKPL